ncbi:MAG: pseudaminic acid synthase [Verrucomicrobia bacterium]|nr:pseudaminic acid synthase [Verrucomicrobiota bacterium]
MSFKTPLKLGKKNRPPFVIAEISANHNGSLERALETITVAKKCGADAVKIQTYTADTMTIDCDLSDFIIKGGLWGGYKLYELYKWAQTPYEWHKTLFDHAKNEDITLFSTPFDVTAVNLLESLNAPAYKIASFELTDHPLIQYVAKTGKPIILSTGMAKEQEIEEAVTAARDSGCKELILLHCISSYPTSINKAHLRQIPTLAKKFNLPIGLSDHTLGITASVAAVALGACVIEKHFTLSRADKGPDSDFSLEPTELTTLCQATKECWLALGRGKFVREKTEKINKKLRRSLYIVQDIKAGEFLTHENLRSIRPGLGISPKNLYRCLGKTVNRDLKRGTPFQNRFLNKK